MIKGRHDGSAHFYAENFDDFPGWGTPVERLRKEDLEEVRTAQEELKTRPLAEGDWNGVVPGDTAKTLRGLAEGEWFLEDQLGPPYIARNGDRSFAVHSSRRLETAPSGPPTGLCQPSYATGGAAYLEYQLWCSRRNSPVWRGDLLRKVSRNRRRRWLGAHDWKGSKWVRDVEVSDDKRK